MAVVIQSKNNSKIGLLSAIFLGVSGIMGSGWLFAPFKSAAIAGPAAILSWIIGALLVLVLSLGFAEIASVYPKRGLSAIIPTLSHNKFFGFPFAIANWLGVVAVIGLEADATVQYLINLLPNLKNLFFVNDHLTLYGNGLSITLVLFYCIVNYWGAKFLAKTNNILTVIKLIVPIVTALIIIAVVFQPPNFTAYKNSFMPFGFKSVLVALVTSGIIVAFNGFQTVVTFASEIEKPHKTIPLALVIAIVISLTVYLLLEVAFIGSMPTTVVARGWEHLVLNAPMVQLSLMLGLGLLASIIYFGATVAPTGAAIAFTGSATRMFTAMSRREQMPKYFDDVHPIYRVSRRSLVMNVILSIVFVLLFRSWSQLAQVLSLFHVISYLPIPIALVVFRNRLVPQRFGFRIPLGKCAAFLMFTLFTYLLTMIDRTILTELMVFLAICSAMFIFLNVSSMAGVGLALKKCYSVILYFVGLLLFAFYAPVGFNGTHQWQSEGLFLVFIAGIFYLMTRTDPDRKMPLKRRSQRAPKLLGYVFFRGES